jgi:hypothetical protein
MDLSCDDFSSNLKHVTIPYRLLANISLGWKFLPGNTPRLDLSGPRLKDGLLALLAHISLRWKGLQETARLDLSGLCLKDRLLALLVHISLGWKGLPGNITSLRPLWSLPQGWAPGLPCTY